MPMNQNWVDTLSSRAAGFEPGFIGADTPDEAIPAEAADAPDSRPEVDYSASTLKGLAKDHGLDATGSKAELRARLVTAGVIV